MRSNHYLDDGSHLALTAVVAFVQSRLASGGELKPLTGWFTPFLADQTSHKCCFGCSPWLIKCRTSAVALLCELHSMKHDYGMVAAASVAAGYAAATTPVN